MIARRLLAVGLAAAVAASFAVTRAPAQDSGAHKIKAVATISIIGDLVRNVGGDRVAVATLVGSNADAHVYSPTPGDVRTVAAANVVFVNGLGLEGWMTRLVTASGTKARPVVVTAGIDPRRMADEAHPGRTVVDPHAWQSVADAKIYVANIRAGLAAVDPAGTAVYAANAAAYLARLDALEQEVRSAIAGIPAERRKIITTHDAFGYFGAAYGMSFVALEGISTETESSAKDVAKIITQIRKRKIPAVFLENVTDPRLMEQIARETGARIGGKLYSDALSEPNGPAATYIDMMQHNIREFAKALGGGA
ncbi:MAG TPA: metal ABC transporter substrate-binding protein [Xanthobacteraceae bacterium]|jgi:zinc/manganese transport system substrate-binding protein|nr:metal ABC transporter substrate-binding protein [Xanthobacteraceae bacterium]